MLKTIARLFLFLLFTPTVLATPETRSRKKPRETLDAQAEQPILEACLTIATNAYLLKCTDETFKNSKETVQNPEKMQKTMAHLCYVKTQAWITAERIKISADQCTEKEKKWLLDAAQKFQEKVTEIDALTKLIQLARH